MIGRRLRLSSCSASNGRTALGALCSRLVSVLPTGSQLPTAEWQRRHQLIVILLAIHAVGIAVYGFVQGVGMLHAIAEGGVVAVFALAAARVPGSRAVRATIASIGLLTASSILVHLSVGLIEMHFHFFVMIALVTLYQSWTPFLIAIGYIILHHGGLGVMMPNAVYNHPDAWENPWKWAGIHGIFVIGASIAGLMNWRLEETARSAIARAEAVAARQQAGREQAEASLRDRDQFLSIASHELLTPVTSLGLYAQLMARQYGKGGVPMQGGIGPRFDVMERQTQKLHRLVSQLLDVTRIESGHLRLERVTTDLVTIVTDVVAMARTRDDRREIRVLCPPWLSCRVDAVRFEQVVTNLVDNALKYSPIDEPVEVEIDETPDGSVRIAIADRGAGIPESLRESIFDRFYRAEETVGIAGVGLGLFVSREIVVLHGGRIDVEDHPGGGTRFVVTLPLLVDAQPAAVPSLDVHSNAVLVTS
jgi:signal transduction histidine kinase